MQMVSMNIEREYTEPTESGYDCSPCIYLNDDQVEALGIKGMPAPGTVFMIQARAVVVSVSAHAEEADEVAKEGNTPDVSLSLRLTDMAAGTTGSTSAEKASILYGG